MIKKLVYYYWNLQGKKIEKFETACKSDLQKVHERIIRHRGRGRGRKVDWKNAKMDKEEI